MTVQITRPIAAGAKPSASRLGASTGVLLIVALAALNGALLMVAARDVPAPFDLPLLRAIQRIDLPYLGAALRPVDLLTSAWGAVVAWTIVLAMLLAARWWRPALVVFCLPLAGLVDNALGLFLFSRPRPSADQVVRVATGTDVGSYPSGHVAGAVLLYGLLFVIAARIHRPAPRWALRALCVVVIGTVGFGRLWYGAHWPTDVLGGYALGALLLLPLVCAYRALDGAGGTRMALDAVRATVARRALRSG